jgi:hypothetical protein
MRKKVRHPALHLAALSSILYALPAMAAAPTLVQVPAPVAPPAPPAPMAETNFVSSKDYGPAPAAKPLPSVIDKKARKDAIKKARADGQACVANRVMPVLLRENSLSSCDLALAVAGEDDGPWGDRAVLLQSRALYLLTLGAAEQALAMLDESDALGKTRNDPLFDGSVGIGNGMLRSVALSNLGRKDEAMAELARLRAIRPYATVISRQLDSIEASFNPDIDVELARWAGKVKWQPNMLRSLLPLYIWRGDLAGASRFADQVSLVDPKSEGGWTLSGQMSEPQQFVAEIQLNAWRAYVWAGVGDDERAGRLIADGYNSIAAYVGNPPVPKIKGEKVSKSEREKYEARSKTGARAKSVLGGWENAITMRRTASGRVPDEVMAEFYRLDPSTAIAMTDIFRQLRSDDKRVEDSVAAILDMSGKQLSNEVLTFSMTRLASALPPPERLEIVPKYKWGEKGGLFSGPNHSQSKEKDSDIRTVRYASSSGTPALAEELALMSVAEYAEREGKDSFILLARREIKRQISHCYYGCGPAVDAGFESQVRVALLDSANIPPEWDAYRDRIISVPQVKADLKPRFDAYEARKEAQKAAERAAKKGR